MILLLIACTSTIKTDTSSLDSGTTDSSDSVAIDSGHDSEVNDSGNDTAAPTGLTVEMTPVNTAVWFYGLTAISGSEEPSWLVCDPSAVRGGACYVVDTSLETVQNDYRSKYTGGLSFLGVAASDIGDGQVCSSDYTPSDANGRLVCWTPVDGEVASVDDVADITYTGDAGAYLGTSAARTNDGSLWFNQTGDGEDPYTVAIFEYDEASGAVTEIASSVCYDSMQFGAMDMLTFGDGVLVSCYGLGASYVTRDGVEWYWDAREQEVLSPIDVDTVDLSDVVDDRVVLSPWLSGSGDSAAIVGNLIGRYSGYLLPDGTFFLVAGFSYAQVDTANGPATASYSIEYASDGESIGTLWVNYQADGDEGAQVLDLPFENPYAEVWRMAASSDGYILATGIDSEYGALIRIQ